MQLILIVLGVISFVNSVRADYEAPPLWPEWTHRHWIWEPGGTEQSVRELVRSYQEHNIPVGAVILDRPWETGDNSLIADPKRYPDLGGLIQSFHEQDIKVMLWITSIINPESSNFDEAKRRNYFVGHGKLLPWWEGKGALLDYKNPAAVDWWHRQMDQVLALNIDGWKCDATDPAIALLDPARTLFTLLGTGRFLAWDHYKEAFYRDFFEYTRMKLGPDRIITARPVDAYATGVAWKFAPTSIGFAGWVGDQDGTFSGLRNAVTNMALSARKKYASFGSDISGYRTSAGMRDPELFVRWAQLGALSTIMENGGRGEHRPWMYGDEVLKIYREFAWLHQELIPLIYRAASRAYARSESAYQEVQGPKQWSYILGDSILVAPLLESGGKRRIQFPKGEWIDFFDESRSFAEGEQSLEFALDRFPVFVKRGAIFAMDIQRENSPHGSIISPGHLTVQVYPSHGIRDFYVTHRDRKASRIRYERRYESLKLSAQASGHSLLYRILGDEAPVTVRLADGSSVPQSQSQGELTRTPVSWYRRKNITWVRVSDGTRDSTVTLEYSVR